MAALRGLVVIVVAAVTLGCGESRAPALLCEGAPCPVERSLTEVFQQSSTRELDLLFVVDDTAAIASRRAALNEDLGRAAAALETSLPGGLPSIHVGVVPASSLSAGGDGCAPPAPRGPECGLAAPARFLATGLCGRMPNFARPFTETLPCLADLGARACGALQPLAAVRRALDPASGAGSLTGFLRPEAHLLVVFVAAGDDASAEDPAQTVAFLRGLKLDPSKVLVSIAGPSAGCGPAGDAPRLKALADAFGSNGLYVGVCDERAISRALEPVTEELGTRLGQPCLPGVRDTDPSAPGLQAECTVEDHAQDVDAPDLPDAPMSRQTRVIPACDVAPPPCWRVSSPTSGCQAGAVTFGVEREPEWCTQIGLDLTVTCLSCAQPDDPACAGP